MAQQLTLPEGTGLWLGWWLVTGLKLRLLSILSKGNPSKESGQSGVSCLLYGDEISLGTKDRDERKALQFEMAV